MSQVCPGSLWLWIAVPVPGDMDGGPCRGLQSSGKGNWNWIPGLTWLCVGWVTLGKPLNFSEPLFLDGKPELECIRRLSIVKLYPV